MQKEYVPPMKRLMLAVLNNTLTLVNGWKAAGSAAHGYPIIGRKDHNFCLLLGMDLASDGQDLFTISIFGHTASDVSRNQNLQPLQVVRTDDWGTVEDIVDGWLSSHTAPNAVHFEEVITSFRGELEPA